MDEFDPLDDRDLAEVEGSNRIIRERMARERAEREAQRQAEASLRGKVLDWLNAGRAPLPAAYIHARVTIHPKGFRTAPALLAARRHQANVDAPEWSPQQMRFWDGFEPACEATAAALRAAGLNLIDEFGSFDAVLALCAPETRSRWLRVSVGLKSRNDASWGLWAALAARGLSALRSEARFRRGLRRVQ